MRTLAHFLAALALALAAPNPAYAQTPAHQGMPYLVKDLNPNPLTSPNSNIAGPFARLGGRLAFAAIDDARTGTELWTSDGTEPGTHLAVDFDPRPFLDIALSEMAPLGDRLVVAGSSADRGFGLWITDGTPGGTSELRTWCQGCAGYQSYFRPTQLTAVASRVFFVAGTFESGQELWVTDGTPDGTHMVADLYPGPRDSTPHIIGGVGNRAVAVCSQTATGTPVVWTDGTQAGTAAFRLGNAGVMSPQFSAGKYGVVVGNTALVFNQNSELWSSDGTQAGTRLVRGTWPQNRPQLTMFGRAGSRAVFYYSAGAQQLWSTDGTAAGTAQLITGVTFNTSNFSFREAGDTAFFSADNNAAPAGTRLYVTDGSPAGTQSLMNLVPFGSSASYAFEAAANHTLVFSRRTSFNSPVAFWVSNGTAAGTVSVATYFSFGPATIQDGVISFAARPSQNARRMLGVSDGTAGGTRLLDIFHSPPSPASGSGALTAALGNRAYFTSFAAGTSRLFSSDGTRAGTGSVFDPADPASPRADGYPSAVDGHVFFFSWNSLTPGEWWITDGTAAGAARLAVASNNNAWDAQSPVLAAGDRFVAPGLVEVWGSDGSGAGGTQRLRTFDRVEPRWALSFNGYAYVVAGAYSNEIWRTDGTVPNTAIIAAFYSSVMSPLVAVNGRIVFAATNETDPCAMYTSTGGPGSAQRLTGFSNAGVNAIGSNGQVALFAFRRPESTLVELWRTDGTIAGTFLVRTFRGTSRSIVTVGSTFIFLADDGVAGLELWRSDGTAAGTALIRDSKPGPIGVGNGTLYPCGDFVLLNVVTDLGREPWITDGTPQGTRRLTERWPLDLPAVGINSAIRAAGRVMLTVTRPDIGNELFAFRVCQGDFDGDGMLDFGDFAAFIDAFDSPPDAPTPESDLNGDGFTDFFDFAEFIDAFEAGC